MINNDEHNKPNRSIPSICLHSIRLLSVSMVVYPVWFGKAIAGQSQDHRRMKEWYSSKYLTGGVSLERCFTRSFVVVFPKIGELLRTTLCFASIDLSIKWQFLLLMLEPWTSYMTRMSSKWLSCLRFKKNLVCHIGHCGCIYMTHQPCQVA